MTAPLSQTWLQFLMLEIVRHHAALTKAKEKVHSLTLAIHRHIHRNPGQSPTNTAVRNVDTRRSIASPTTTAATIAERRKQFEVDRLLLRQAQDHELFLLKQAQDMEILLHDLERDNA